MIYPADLTLICLAYDNRLPESSPHTITEGARLFLEPPSPARRQYEALRAYFLEGLTSQELSQLFGYTPGSFRVRRHHFRRSKPDLFRQLKPGPHTQPKKNAVRGLIPGMRKQNFSIYDIQRTLKEKGTPLSLGAGQGRQCADLIFPLGIYLLDRPALPGPAPRRPAWKAQRIPLPQANAIGAGKRLEFARACAQRLLHRIRHVLEANLMALHGAENVTLDIGPVARVAHQREQRFLSPAAAAGIHRPNSKLETAYHKGDKAIESIIKLLAVA